MYSVLSKQDTKLKSVTLSDIRIPCNANMKTGWLSEKQPKRLLEGKGFLVLELQPLMVYLSGDSELAKY